MDAAKADNSRVVARSDVSRRRLHKLSKSIILNTLSLFQMISHESLNQEVPSLTMAMLFPLSRI